MFVVLLAGLLYGPAPAFAQESAPHRIQIVDEIGGSPMLQTWEGDRVYVSRHSRIDVLDARGAGLVIGTAGPFGWGIYSMAVKHQILAVVSDDVHVFDFSRPDRPRWIASAPLQGEPGSARWVEDELWVTHLGRVRRYDLSDPYQPRVLPDWLPGNPNHNPPFIVAAIARGEGRHVVLIEYLNNHRSGLVQELLTVELQGDETPRVVGRMKVPCCESNRLLSIDGALILAYAWKGLSLRKVVMDADGLPAGLQELALLDLPASSVYIAHTKGVIWLVDRGRTFHMLDESSFEALRPPRSPESMFGCPSRTQGIHHLALRDRLLVVACDRAFWLDADGRVTPGPAWSVTRIGGVFSGPGHVLATALLPGQSDWRFTRVESGGGSIGLRPMSGPLVGPPHAIPRRLHRARWAGTRGRRHGGRGADPPT